MRESRYQSSTATKEPQIGRRRKEMNKERERERYENMASNKMKMGRDGKQYNFIDDRNEEYFLDERGTGLTGWKAVLRMKQSNEIWHQRESHVVGDSSLC
jgi:hypothetical protein